ncbi:MAG TPA: NHL repeat-containing protein [Chthoniobacterales bacterium]|jgi:sugar lactone lactonase YvrE
MKKRKFLRSLIIATVLTGTSLTTYEAHAAAGNIFESNDGMILRFAPNGGAPGTFASGLSNPKGIVFDGKGNVFVADAGNGTIFEYPALNGSSPVAYITGLSSPIGLAVDSAGNLYEADAGSGTIFEFAIDKTQSTFASGLGQVSGLAFDAAGNLFAADFSNGTILKFAPDKTKSTFASGLSGPAGLAVDNSGNVFEADSGSNTIFKFAPNGTKSSFATGLNVPYGLAIDASGNLVVGDHDSGSTIQFAPDGTKTTLFSNNFNSPEFVAVEPGAHLLLNISTRGFVQTGDHVLIAGFIIGGNGPAGVKVVVRAIGPSLTASGIPDALQDPVLELHNASGALLASNNNWKDTQQTAIEATTLNPKDDHESAIVTTLVGGSYTAIVRGVNNTTGTALVEVYNLQ